MRNMRMLMVGAAVLGTFSASAGRLYSTAVCTAGLDTRSAVSLHGTDETFSRTVNVADWDGTGAPKLFVDGVEVDAASGTYALVAPATGLKTYTLTYVSGGGATMEKYLTLSAADFAGQGVTAFAAPDTLLDTKCATARKFREVENIVYSTTWNAGAYKAVVSAYELDSNGDVTTKGPGILVNLDAPADGAQTFRYKSEQISPGKVYRFFFDDGVEVLSADFRVKAGFFLKIL